MALTEHSAEGYERYTQGHTYRDMPGVVVAPSSNRTGYARLLRTHGKAAVREVTFDAARIGAPPALPKPENTDGDTFISADVTLPLPAANARTGTYTFMAAGRYTYLQDGAGRVPGTDPLPTGGYPYPLAVQGLIATVAYADAIAAAVGQANPADYAVRQAGLDYTGSATTGWFLTAFPAETFVTTTISG